MNLTINTDTRDTTGATGISTTSAILHLAGDIDYTTADGLVAAAARLHADHPELRHLHLDCADVAFCDSAGVSSLLQIRQRTGDAGVHLYLDRRPVHLERILEITGILEYLTAAPAPARGEHRREAVELADESGVV